MEILESKLQRQFIRATILERDSENHSYLLSEDIFIFNSNLVWKPSRTHRTRNQEDKDWRRERKLKAEHHSRKQFPTFSITRLMDFLSSRTNAIRYTLSPKQQQPWFIDFGSMMTFPLRSCIDHGNVLIAFAKIVKSLRIGSANVTSDSNEPTTLKGH